MSSSQNAQSDLLQKLEELEGQNASVGRYEFITLKALSSATSLDISALTEVLEVLQERRLIIWDKSAGVKSRIGHILFALRNSEARSRNQQPLRNVSDLKYIRYVKRIPRYIIDLNELSTHEKLNELLKFTELESSSGPVISASLSSISGQFQRISQFQMRATLEILRMLYNPGQSSNLVLVADTGGGKSFAYQLPLFLWILAKKMRSYFAAKSVNCSALLVFPRNVLAEDQWEDLTSLAQLIQRRLDKLSIPSDFKELLAFRIKRDFGGSSREDLAKIYSDRLSTDIIVTNTETMKRRLMNPTAHEIYRDGIDLVLFDEIHLYTGLHGAYVAGLNARLKAILPTSPVFVGMSATIAKPEKHCQKLFALQEKPLLINDRDDLLENKVVEHHVILKPRPGRPPLGVAIDTTSCLLHNRRDGVSSVRGMLAAERPKTICFSDSLDTSGRWTLDQNDLEFFDAPATIPPTEFHRGYPFYYMPALRPNSQPSFGQACIECHEARDVICSVCDHYVHGRCWWFSRDSGDGGTWRRIGNFGNFYIPEDNIRSRRLTAQEVRFDEGGTIYDLYKAPVSSFVGPNRVRLDEVEADNLVATSVLEVGVDFRGIKEIIMYGEISSPASYKQKAGRGAREGNMEDGLFVMTVVPQLPLANFYYRHFRRLVNPSLSPVPLEPSNPDALKSHAFAGVLDYLAKRQIDIFNIIEVKNDEAGVEAEFEKALELIRNSRSAVEEHARRFLKLCGTVDEGIVNRSVEEVVRLLQDLSGGIELDGVKKRFVSWIFEGSRNPNVLRSLDEKVRSEYDKMSLYTQSIETTRDQFIRAKAKLEHALADLGEPYQEIAAEVKRFEP